MKPFSKRQLQIINTSIELIGSGGIQELTIKNLSRKIGFVEAAVYRHFTSKSELLLAVLEHLSQNVEKKLAETMLKDSTAFDKIKESIEAYFVYLAENTALVTLHLSDGIYKNEPVAQQKVLKIMDDIKNHFKVLITEARKSNLVLTDIDDEALSMIILGALRMYVTRWSLDGHIYDVKTDAEKVYAIINSILSKK